MPRSEFTWLEDVEIERLSNPLEVLVSDDEAEYGYWLEVALDYPRELHASIANFPVVPEESYISTDMFYPLMTVGFNNNLSSERGKSNVYKSYRKHLLTQCVREYYNVFHYYMENYFLRMGMRLARVRFEIRFRQKSFLEPYISYNSGRRAEANSGIEKDY